MVLHIGSLTYDYNITIVAFKKCTPCAISQPITEIIGNHGDVQMNRLITEYSVQLCNYYVIKYIMYCSIFYWAEHTGLAATIRDFKLSSSGTNFLDCIIFFLLLSKVCVAFELSTRNGDKYICIFR